MSIDYIPIPKEIENMQLPDPDLLNQYIDLKNRIIWVADEIDIFTLNIIQDIVNWNRADEQQNIPIEKRKPIKLIFFSPGGDLDIHNSLIDVIELSKTPIYGINAGRCCSAAAFIFLSCHKRFTLSRAFFLFHQGSGAFAGSYGEVTAQIENYQEQVSNLALFMAKRTKYSGEEIANNITSEWYIDAKEAKEKGVCDEIIDSIDELL